MPGRSRNSSLTPATAIRPNSGSRFSFCRISPEEVSSALSSVSTYSTFNSNSTVNTLADLGVTFSDANDGTLTFDPSVLSKALSNNPNDVASFLGSAATGGFLQAASNALTSAADPTSGIIITAENDLNSQITDLTNTINDKQDQVDNLQPQLTNQMNAADASIASMQQQYVYLSGMFQAMQTADQQYK